MTQDEQIEFLGLKKLNVLDRLNIILNGDFQITGSISLFEYGIVKRKINDIDIVVPSLEKLKLIFDKKDYDFQEWFDYSDKLENPKNTLQGKGKVTNRISFKIDGIKCCAFYGEMQGYKFFRYMIDRKFKVSHPKYSILAKKKYVFDLLQIKKLNSFQIKKLKKHILDIAAYYEKKD